MMASIPRCVMWATLLLSVLASLDGAAGDCNAADAPQAGGALLQSQSSTKAVNLHGQAPLQGRITTALSEVASLQQRVEGIMSVVGASESGAAAAAVQKDASNFTKIDAAALYARYKDLLQNKKESEATLKEDVATLETDCSTLKSNVLLLENQVQGSSLLAKESAAESPTSLSTRVEAVEKDIEDLRTRVTSLEQVVVGLQMKSQKKKEASLMQVGTAAKTTSRTGLGPLSARLSALEKEVESLQQRSETLDNEIQGGGAGVLGLAEEDEAATPAQKPRRQTSSLLEQGATISRSESRLDAELGEGTIKERTAALETSVAALKSKMAMLENEAVGRTSADSAASLLQVSGSGESLKARINSLEDEVDSLRTRVTTLEHVVEG